MARYSVERAFRKAVAGLHDVEGVSYAGALARRPPLTLNARPSRLLRTPDRRRGPWIGLLVAALSALLTLSAGIARAGDPGTSRTSSLSWIRLPGAEPCVSAQDLARDVEQRLGHRVFVSPSQADVSVEGHIEPNVGAAGWHAVVVLRDARGGALGTREIRREEASCDSMRAPLALVIAIMIDPDATLSPPAPPAPATTPAPAPPPIVIEKPVPVIVKVPVPAPPPSTWRLDAGTSVIGGLGLLPAPAVGLLGEAILDPPIPIGLEGYAALWFDPGPAPTFSFAYVGGGLCPLEGRWPLVALYACASGQLGYLKSSGTGPALTPTDQVHVAVDAEARGTLRLAGPFTARGGLSLIIPLIRETFVQDQPGGVQVFRMSAVAATLDLGVGVAFP